MWLLDLNTRLAAKAAPDSILGVETVDARLHHTRALPWVWLIWLFWLFAPPVFGATKYYPHWLWATLTSIPVFLVLYVMGHLCARRRIAWYALGVAALAIATIAFNGYAGTYVIYACALASEWSKPRRAFVLMLALLGAFSISWVTLGGPWEVLANFWVISLIVGGIGIYGCLQRQRRAELRLTHDEIRRLAASAERERIGRDLHDLLGHTLSMVALKSELAGRLIERDPRAARREMADVERVARDALSQVRSAVSGIRAAAMAAELASARLLLEAAGVQMEYWHDPQALPGDVETCLALVLREAVTNIQRHARANRVEVTVIAGAERVVLRVRDDGRGGVNERGNGLTGMRERIEARGGTLAIESPRGRGTSIEVSLPLVIEAAPVEAPASKSAPVLVPRVQRAGGHA